MARIRIKGVPFTNALGPFRKIRKDKKGREFIILNTRKRFL